jgi:catechol-2,3-dioxygenase
MNARLGHLVLHVSDLARSTRFYCEVLGLRRRRGGIFNGDRMVLLTFGENDHDLGLVELPAPARSSDASAPGLGHVAFRIGDSIEALREFKRHLERLGIRPQQMTEHLYARSIYLRDPDGMGVEVYVEAQAETPYVEGDVEINNPRLQLD